MHQRDLIVNWTRLHAMLSLAECAALGVQSPTAEQFVDPANGRTRDLSDGAWREVVFRSAEDCAGRLGHQ